MKLALALMYFCLAAFAGEPSPRAEATLKSLFPKASPASLQRLAGASAKEDYQEFAKIAADLLTDVDGGLNQHDFQELMKHLVKIRIEEQARDQRDPVLLKLIEHLIYAGKEVDGKPSEQADKDFVDAFKNAFQAGQNENKLAYETLKQRGQVKDDPRNLGRQVRANRAYHKLAAELTFLKQQWQDGTVGRDEMKKKSAELVQLLHELESNLSPQGCLPGSEARKAAGGDH